MGLLTNLIWLVLLPLLVSAKFNQTPRSQDVILGETLTLRCAFTQGPGLLTYWLKGTDHISMGRNILADIGGENIRRYSIVGDDFNGEYFLKIIDVKVEDAGEYRCAYVMATTGSTSPPAMITVIVPPKADFPVCLSTPDPGSHKPGSTVQLNCISLGGVPRANLTWTRDAVKLGNVTIDNNKITRVLTPDDNGVFFTCSATSPALRKPRTCTIMPMKIPPSPIIKGSANISLVGDNFTASCNSNGIPAIGSYSWFIDGRPIDFVNTRFYAISHHIKIRNLHKTDNNVILTCMVTTTLGLTGNYSILLKVEQPTTTELPTTATSIPIKATDTSTNSYPMLEGDKESGVNTKDHTNTSVTRYNMKLILALIFGMLIFIFIIILMTLTYFFASHTTRPRQKESGYEDTTLGPNYKTEVPVSDRVLKVRDFPHYPQTYVSQEIHLTPDGPLATGIADVSYDQSIYPESSSEIEFGYKDSREKLTDEEKIEYMQAAVDPISNADLVSDVTEEEVIHNDATATQEAPLTGLEELSVTHSEQSEASPEANGNGLVQLEQSSESNDLDEHEEQAMTSNIEEATRVENNNAQECTVDARNEDTMATNTVEGNEDATDTDTPTDALPTEDDTNIDANANTIRALQLAEEID